MKLSRNDLRILMALRKQGRPMANYEIAKALNINPAQSHKRLVILSKEKVLHSIEGYPKFYSFNGKNLVQNFVVLTVECPKCESVHVIHQNQTTVQCTCETASGKRTRFYIYSRRIRDMKVFDPFRHEEPALVREHGPFGNEI